MIVRLFAFVIAFTMLISATSAHATTGLKAAFDELQYALSVEWDQSDRAFYDAQMKKFTATVSKLQTEGLTNDEIIKFVETQVKDEAAAKDIATTLNIINLNKMNSAEATQFMLETMKRSYSQGSSWNWDYAPMMISAVLVIGVVLLIVHASNNTPDATTTQPPVGCQQYYQCNPFCYNDAVYGYTCQQNCFWMCY